MSRLDTLKEELAEFRTQWDSVSAERQQEWLPKITAIQKEIETLENLPTSVEFTRAEIVLLRDRLNTVLGE